MSEAKSSPRRHIRFVLTVSIAIAFFLAAIVVFAWLLPPQPRLSLPGSENCHLVGFSGDGSRVVTVRYAKPPVGRKDACPFDAPIELWDTATGEKQAALATGSLNVVVLSPDGRIVAADDGGQYSQQKLPHRTNLRLWDLPAGREIITLSLLESDPFHVRWRGVNWWFSPDSHLLAYHDQYSDWVKLLDLSTRQVCVTLPGAYGRVAFSPDGRTIATGIRVPKGEDDPSGKAAPIQLWDVDSGKKLTMLKGREGPGLCSLAFSPSGTILAADDHCDVRFYGDGEILATKSREECVRLWDIATGKSRAALDATGHFDFVFSPHGELLMVRQEVLFMYFHSLWDVRTTQPREIQLKSGEKAMANAAIGLLGAGLLGAGSLDAGFPKNPFSPDGRFFATAAKREVSIYEIATMQECASLPLSWHVDSFPVFSPDSKTLAAGGVYVPAGWLDAVRTGPEVKLWDIAASEEQVTLRWCGKPVFSPDGKTLATQGMMGNTIQLWDLPASRSVSLPIVLGAVTTLLVFAGVNRYGLCPTLTIAITAFVLWLLGMAGLWYFARLSLAKVLSLGNIHGLAAVLALLLVVGGRWCLLRLRRRTPADGWHAQSLR